MWLRETADIAEDLVLEAQDGASVKALGFFREYTVPVDSTVHRSAQVKMEVESKDQQTVVREIELLRKEIIWLHAQVAESEEGTRIFLVRGGKLMKSVMTTAGCRREATRQRALFL